MDDPMGEGKKDSLRVNFDNTLEFELHGVSGGRNQNTLIFMKIPEKYP